MEEDHPSRQKFDGIEGVKEVFKTVDMMCANEDEDDFDVTVDNVTLEKYAQYFASKISSDNTFSIREWTNNGSKIILDFHYVETYSAEDIENGAPPQGKEMNMKVILIGKPLKSGGIKIKIQTVDMGSKSTCLRCNKPIPFFGVSRLIQRPPQ